MPAKSIAQRQFMGMVEAYKKGKLKKGVASTKMKKVAASMPIEEVHKYAATKESRLPKRKKAKNYLRAVVMGM